MGSACSVKISPQAQSTLTAKPAWPEPTVCATVFVRPRAQIYMCPYRPVFVSVRVCVLLCQTPQTKAKVGVCMHVRWGRWTVAEKGIPQD